MPIFTSGCSSDEGAAKYIKIEGNTLTILQGSSSVFTSSDLSMRQWYDEVSTWQSSSDVLIPSGTKTIDSVFDFLFIKVEPPSLPIGTTGVVLQFKADLYLVGSLIPDLTFTIRDIVLFNFNEDYEKIIFSNTSTGTTLPYKISFLIAKTTL